MGSFDEMSGERWVFDAVKLREDLMGIDSGFIETYLDETFEEECSKSYQRQMMFQHPFFGRKVLDNYLYPSEEQKQDVFLKSLVYGDKGQGRIVLVDGSMGGGKTGFGCWVIDEFHERNNKMNFFFVTKSETHPELPKWIKIVKNMTIVETLTAKSKLDSVALVDEGAIQLSSRGAMQRENKDASAMLVKLRQKGITMIILVQHVKMIDVNVRRLANIRCLKHGIDFGGDDVPSEDMKHIRRRLKPRSNREAYIEIAARGICLRFKHGLPEWWDDDKVSKYMKDWTQESKPKEIAVVQGKKKEINSAEDLFDL